MNFEVQKLGFLTLVTLLVGTHFVFGQKRTVDLEVICVSPADTVVNGVGDRLRFGMQNNGPDTLYRQDTILYWLYVFENDSTGYVVYNGATIGTAAGFVPIGDARYYNDNYNITFPYPGRKDTFTVEFCVVIGSTFISDVGDTVSPFGYVDPDNGNNMCCTPVTIIPKPSQTSIASADNANGLQVYPNPAKNVLNVNLPSTPAGGEVLVSIWDVNGRRVLSEAYSAGNAVLRALPLDVSSLPAGIYQLQVQSAGEVLNQKVVIRK